MGRKEVPMITVLFGLPNGTCLSMNVNDKWSCDKVKRMVMERVKGMYYQSSNCRMVHQGRVLENHRPCADYGIVDGSWVQMVSELRG
jgi:hypothetical protein